MPKPPSPEALIESLAARVAAYRDAPAEPRAVRLLTEMLQVIDALRAIPPQAPADPDASMWHASQMAIYRRLETLAKEEQKEIGLINDIRLKGDMHERAAAALMGRLLPAERGPCIPMCRLASSTHEDAEGVERCDLCGHPAEPPPPPAPAAPGEMPEVRECHGCGYTLVRCYDCKRSGAVACCPDCDHSEASTEPSDAR